MHYAKSKLPAPNNELLNDEELKKIEINVGVNKTDQLVVLNRKVKQFEEKVAREEVRMRHLNPGNDAGTASEIYEAQT